MTQDYLAGRRIERVAGLLESTTMKPPIKRYTAVLGFDDGTIILLTPSDFAQVKSWPEGLREMPMQVLDGHETIVGERIKLACYLHPRMNPARQLFFATTSGRFVGVVNTARGTVMHVESILAAPSLRGDPELTDVSGRAVSIDDLVLS